MDHINQATQQISKRVWFITFFSQLIAGGVLILLASNGVINTAQTMALSVFVWAIIALVATASAQQALRAPLDAVSRAILHVSPSQHGIAAPKLETLSIGRAYVTDIVKQIQELASIQTDQQLGKQTNLATQSTSILSHLPLPLFVFNSDQLVTFASDNALDYTGVASSELFGKSLYDSVELEFSSDFTLEAWIKECQQNKAKDTAYWQRVRVRSKSNPELFRQCDIAGSYSRENPAGIEFVITLFDHTQEYDQDDQSMNFVALAVHELRTPLTIMRGYLEAFQDELTDTTTPESKQYLERLQASTMRLSSFVNNILNVARIQENQLAINLAEENWSNIVAHACQDMTIQASAHDKVIVQQLPTELPSVGVDRTTIYEVLCNLIDNAIKYSGASDQIVVSARVTTDGLIETSVQDSGVGIPASVLPTLFEKFHRNHRNRSQISGTGLGLYISKAIVNAHEGNIWVNSTEGKGSTFSFTVKPYSSLATDTKTSNNDGMMRTAHGWIKNHSMYRK